jgi:hypothetical protein
MSRVLGLRKYGQLRKVVAMKREPRRDAVEEVRVAISMVWIWVVVRGAMVGGGGDDAKGFELYEKNGGVEKVW